MKTPTLKALLIAVLCTVGLAGCVAYPVAPPGPGVYVAPPAVTVYGGYGPYYHHYGYWHHWR